uniref:Protein tyrosine kinase 7 (inactive) n=1 Tax=Denticeps clupeoides TaxID=299321 RepID=A0AAY4DN54_9TELE
DLNLFGVLSSNVRMDFLIQFVHAGALHNNKGPKSQDAYHGRSAMLRCEAGDPVAVLYRWLHNGVPVSDTERRFQAGSNLKFLAVDRILDSGIFQCVAFNNATGEEVRSANTSFNIKWLDSGAVTLQNPASEADIESSSPVTLRCNIDGHPRPTCRWFKDGVQLTDATAHHHINNKERTLTLPKANPDHNGLYYCCAKNPAGQTCSKFNFTLNITDKGYPKPVISPEDLVVMKNEEAMFHCQFTAEPLPTLEWYHDTELITNKSRLFIMSNGSLFITQVKPRNTGLYKCVGKGPKGQTVTLKASLHLAELEDMVSRMSRVFTANSLERVSCQPPRGTPEPEAWWEHGGQRVATEGRVYQDGLDLVFSPTKGEDSGLYTCVAQNKAGQKKLDLTVTVANGSEIPPRVKQNAGLLLFSKVTRDDAGNYTCLASNSMQGEIRAVVQLTVAVYVVFKLEPENTTVYQGHTAILHCQASGDPSPYIQWKKKDKFLDATRSRFHKMPNGSLIIYDVSIEDTGSYTCIAGNSCNIGHTSAELYVVEKPVHHALEVEKTPYKMIQTIGLSVGAAVAYIIVVLGLMFYCKKRRNAKRQKGNEGDEPEMQHLNAGGQQNGQTTAEIQDEVSLTTMAATGNTAKRYSSHDKLHFPRTNLNTITVLGKGEFGEVFLAKAKADEIEEETVVLVKSLQTRDEQLQQEFRREADMFAKLSHANIARLLGMCREAEPHYMILEYSDMGDLKQFLKVCKSKDEKNKVQPLSTKQKVSVCLQVARGMEHLSNQRFVHRDLAARNCMISSKRHIKVCALGLSKDIYHSEYYHYRQAWIPLRWLPAESVFEDDFSTKTDVWAFGVLMWEVFSFGELPHVSMADDQVLEGLREGKLKMSPPQGCPSRVYKLMVRCWAASPKDRVSFSEIVSTLSELPSESKV